MKDRAILDLLAQRLHGQLVAGQMFSGAIEADDLVADIQIRVRRRVPLSMETVYRIQALRILEADPYRAHRCSSSTQRKPYAGATYTYDCSRNVTAVIVTYTWPTRVPEACHSFRFVCTVHAERHHIDAQYVLAVVRLPQQRVKTIRDRQERAAAAERHKKWQQEEGARAIAGWLGRWPWMKDELAARRAARGPR